MEIVIIKQIRIGSTVFFNSFNDFKSKDIDELCILSSPIEDIKSFCLKLNGKDLILYPNLSKDEFIKEDLKVNDSLKVGKYLVPEFIDYIGLKIEDLHKLKPLVNKLDIKHSYEKIIYDSYLNNSEFYLTDEQKNKAYIMYKKARNIKN